MRHPILALYCTEEFKQLLEILHSLSAASQDHTFAAQIPGAGHNADVKLDSSCFFCSWKDSRFVGLAQDMTMTCLYSSFDYTWLAASCGHACEQQYTAEHSLIFMGNVAGLVAA